MRKRMKLTPDVAQGAMDRILDNFKFSEDFELLVNVAARQFAIAAVGNPGKDIAEVTTAFTQALPDAIAFFVERLKQDTTGLSAGVRQDIELTIKEFVQSETAH